MDVRTMHGAVTAGRPTGALTQPRRMIDTTDENGAPGPDLGMTLQAQIVVTFGEQTGVNGTVRLVACTASFFQGLVPEHEQPRLLLVTLAALIVTTRHRQAARRLHDVHPVRIMTNHAVHLAFLQGMMMRQMELGLHIPMAIQACLRVASGIVDEHAQAAAGRRVLAARAVAGLAPGQTGRLSVGSVHPGMGTGVKRLADPGVTVVAGLIAHVARPRNLDRHHLRPPELRAGSKAQPAGQTDEAKAKGESFRSGSLLHGLREIGNKAESSRLLYRSSAKTEMPELLNLLDF